jgi:hypothetical protein
MPLVLSLEPRDRDRADAADAADDAADDGANDGTDAEAAAAASTSPGLAIGVYPDHVGSGFARAAPPATGAVAGDPPPPWPLHLVVEQWDGGI